MNQHKQLAEKYELWGNSPIKKIEFHILPYAKSTVSKGKLMIKYYQKNQGLVKNAKYNRCVINYRKYFVL